MARIRANLNSFSTGFVSKKIRGNVDFEGYNNGLEECSNFLIQHTGGIFKRGGTEFVAYTKDSGKAELIPFYFGVESYICEFGDLKTPAGENRYYIRFYTKSGFHKELLHNLFSLDDFSRGNTFQRGANLTIVMLTKIVNITSDDAYAFSIEEESFTYPPLSKTNYDTDKTLKITPIANTDKYKIEAVTPATDGLFYQSDANEVICINGEISDEIKKMSFRIKEFTNSNTIVVEWEDRLNFIKKPEITADSKFVEWSISQFTKDRVKDDQIDKLGITMYEGRLFLSANNVIWGSSLAREDPLDFMQEPTDDGGVSFSISETNSDDIIWLCGKSKLFIATSGGLFMSGAATTNDSAVTPSNFRVRLFEKIGVSALPPISANNAIFFVDAMNRNVHEIVLSAETGTYQANDLSLIGEDLTHSGIIAHTWQQTPIKTYWCAVEDGSLCSLTYLKNNGIMAWAKHIIAGKNSKVETISTLTTKSSDNIWMIVKRQSTKDSGEQEIVRSIEYMHPIYDPSHQEEFKQFFVDSGKITEKKHTILSISNGYNYRIALDTDVRISTDSFETKIILAAIDGRINFMNRDKMSNPFLDFARTGPIPIHPKPLIARNFHKKDGKYFFDVFDCYDFKREANGNPNIPYRNQSITHGKIDVDLYFNDFNYAAQTPAEIGIFIKVSNITKIEDGLQTKIHCDMTNISNGDTVILLGTGLVNNNNPLDYVYSTQLKYSVVRIDTGYFFVTRYGTNNEYIESAKTYDIKNAEVFKLVKKIRFNTIDQNLLFGKDAVFEIKGGAIDAGTDVYVNKVSGMEEVNGKKYKVKKSWIENDKTYVTLHDYSKSPDESSVYVPLDAYAFGIYDIDQQNNGNMYEYFTKVDGLEHLNNQEIAICSNGNSLSKRKVEKIEGWYGFRLENPSMYCVSGLPIVSKLKTLPFSGGNVLGSSVGVVGQQVHAVFNLYYSLGGVYGTEEDKTYVFNYKMPTPRPFDISKNLFTGSKKLPLINAKAIYDRCIYIEHRDPLSYNLLSITEEMSVTDA